MKSMLILCSTLFFTNTLPAQIGLKMGLSISNFKYDGGSFTPYQGYEADLRPYLGYDIEWVQLTDQKPNLGPYLGVYYAFAFAKRFSIQPELSFTQKGVNFSQAEYQNIKYKVKINYLELPLSVTCNYLIKEKFIGALYAGGFGSIRLNAVKKIETPYTELSKTSLDNAKSFEGGVHMGLNFKYAVSDQLLFLDIKYCHGLSDVFYANDDQIRIYEEAQNVRNLGLNFSIGYEF